MNVSMSQKRIYVWKSTRNNFLRKRPNLWWILKKGEDTLGKGFTESFESGRRYRVRSPKGRWRRREVLNGEEKREREEEEMAATEPLCREGC
jgi:hypothetical protein